MSQEVSTAETAAVASLFVAGGAILEYTPRAFNWLVENLTREDVVLAFAKAQGAEKFDNLVLSKVPEFDVLPDWLEVALKLTDEEKERLSRKFAERSQSRSLAEGLGQLHLNSPANLRLPRSPIAELHSSEKKKVNRIKRKLGKKHNNRSHVVVAEVVTIAASAKSEKRAGGRVSPNRSTVKMLSLYDDFRSKCGSTEKAIELAVRKNANDSVRGVKKVRKSLQAAVRTYRPND